MKFQLVLLLSVSSDLPFGRKIRITYLQTHRWHEKSTEDVFDASKYSRVVVRS